VKAPRARKSAKRQKKKKDPLYDREEIFEAFDKLGTNLSYHSSSTARINRCSRLQSAAPISSSISRSLTPGDDPMDTNIAAYLELLGHHSVYRSSPQALYLAQDKSIAKKIFDFHKIKNLTSATSYKGRPPITRTISSFR